MLACSTLAQAAAENESDSDAAAPAPVATEAPAPSPEIEPSQPTVQANGDLVYLPAAKYIEEGRKALGGFDTADRQALQKFYRSSMGTALWVDRHGYNAEAKNLIAAFQDADNWGLNSADYKVPALTRNDAGEFDQDALTAAEVRLSLSAMKYARDARGGRIIDPSGQLSTYIDRKPQLLDPCVVIDALADAPDKGAYLRSLQPKNPQFERLREKLVELRKSAKERESLKIPDGRVLRPGKSDPQIALIRKVLEVPAPSAKKDGSPADADYYDDALADAVRAYKETNGIRPASTAITNTLRRSLNQSHDVSEEKLIANMEEWRWMPADLGKFYVQVNIPEFKVRVVDNGNVIFDERIVVGRDQTQTPIFSSPMRTIVLQPRWNVPDSIKIKELLPGLRAGGNPLRRQGLVMERSGRRIDPWNVDWYRADIRNFNVYQPPGPGNALGLVKFLFPNKHAVYLHDTPSKSLFKQSVRTFSHGCMRVHNPIKLAELLLNKDKGWGKGKVDGLIENGPEENEVALSEPIPVHITYFTARAEKDGTIGTFNDIYGHEKRITLALQGRWSEIEKNDEKHISPEDYPVASGWDDDRNWRRSRRDFDDYDYAYDDRYDDGYDQRRYKRKGPSGPGGFFGQLFGGF
jgi:murein L,D-transpeptidase YcbB/YkuD